MSRFKLRVAAAALRSGSGLGSSKQIHYRPNVHEVTVRGHRPVPYQVDGDHLGELDELVFRYEPDVLSLVVPDTRAITR